MLLGERPTEGRRDSVLDAWTSHGLRRRTIRHGTLPPLDLTDLKVPGTCLFFFSLFAWNLLHPSFFP